MKLYVIRYKETKDGATRRTECLSKKDQRSKIKELGEKGFIIVDVF